MYIDQDPTLEQIVDKLTPLWSEVRARRAGFSRTDENTFMSTSIIFIGTPSLMCSVQWKIYKTNDIEMDYFPIALSIENEAPSEDDDWITLFRAAGQSGLDNKARWLFDKPSLQLLEGEDFIAEGAASDTPRHYIRFFKGLKVTDAQRQKSLNITSSNQPYFEVCARLCG